jgi:S-adenosylmethionine hydrolase
MARPLIALLTDFGTADHYVGAMKGVMLGICPDATLVDITHDITPHDVLEGAVELDACYRAFPAGTVFLAVVDPGVGSARRGIAASFADYRFVAPDNGILTAVFRGGAPARVVEISEARYARPEISRTFEGRDRFAPAAAWLAAGVEVTALGPDAGDPVTIVIPAPAVGDGQMTGEVLRIDRFGNAVTNIDRDAWQRSRRAGRPEIRVGGWRTTRLVDTYADLRMGEAGALFGSRGSLELSAREASAASLLGIRRGERVMVRWVAEGRDADGF